MARHKFVKDTDKGWNRIKREIYNAKTISVVVGIQEGDGNPKGKAIAEYAAYNEFGTKRIPERSFMRSSFDENYNVYFMLMAQQYDQVKTQRKTVRSALGFVGLKVETDIKEKIRNFKIPPNAESTIAKKGDDNPLIDGGHMLNSVRFIYRAV